MNNIDTILAERKKTHGEFRDHARVTQALKRVMEGEHSWKKLSDIQREALSVIAHKIGRILTGDPNHQDHWVDISGYSKLVSDRLNGGVPRTDSNKHALQTEIDEILENERRL